MSEGHSCSFDLAVIAANLKDLPRVCDQCETLETQAAEADRRVARHFLVNGKFPERAELKTLGVFWQQWFGQNSYAEGAVVAHRAFHRGRLEAYRAVEKLIQDSTFENSIPSELRTQRIEEVARAIFPLLSIEERAQIADNKVAQFLISKKEMPLAGRKNNHFKEMGFEYKQYVGSGEFGEGKPKQHLRFHQDEASALEAVLKTIEETPISEDFTDLDKQKVRNILALRISSLKDPIEKQTDLADRFIVEWMILTKETPTIETFETMGISYDRWSGTKDYSENGDQRNRTYHPNSNDGWSKIYERFVESVSQEDMSREEKVKLMLELREKIQRSAKPDWDQIREDDLNAVLKESIYQEKPPSYGQMAELVHDVSRLTGTGSHREDKGLFLNPALFWTEIKRRIENAEVPEVLKADLTDELKSKLIVQVEEKIREAEDRILRSMKPRALIVAENDVKIVHFLIQNNRAPTYDEFSEIDVPYNQWAGIGAYRKEGIYSHLAFHENPTAAYSRVISLIGSVPNLSPARKAELVAIVESKIREYEIRNSK